MPARHSADRRIHRRLAALLAPPTAAAQFGSSGLGDEYFPLAGNGGYDVGHYILRLDYDPATDVLDGHVTIRATATESLSRFNLDFRGFDIQALSGWTTCPRRSLRDGQD